MTKEEAMQIIKNENLQFFNWFNDHDISPNEVLISQQGNIWRVSTTDERTNAISEKEFDSEEKALENFIKRVRGLNKFQNLSI
ncbi:hypothetical protein RGU12_09005 [Fredinandcohnia sp. QZ13]|uniref:hypothetical protein n=1 Tax=Fredinandcohnia sp. QZ13 TaxID=3073144 RepID=UPI002853261F|nr:hypothetical protein [Fredinandcohnia sp. QZ13]MDR4887683.1 hypothetical protein [Fredinandcohnia sp. QZ13]